MEEKAGNIPARFNDEKIRQARALGAAPELSLGRPGYWDDGLEDGEPPDMMSSIWFPHRWSPIRAAQVIASTLSRFSSRVCAPGILLINDATDLGIDLLHRRFRHVLVLRHRTPRKTSPSFSP